VPAIIKALEAEEGETKEWAEKTLATLGQRSPTSVYVTLRQMRLGQKWSIAETFQREHQLAGKFMRHPDFTEGVNALLIRKDGKPKWQPPSLDAIKPEDNIADPFFEVEGSKRLPLLNDIDYTEYPHARFGIPTESAVEAVVKAGGLSQKGVVDHFLKQRKDKQGVRELVQEIVKRKTKKEDGNLVWIPTPAAES
jgi:3-hydroxyisobutyryl-CoA hydrolase